MNLLDKIKKGATAAAVFLPGISPFVTLATMLTPTTKDDVAPVVLGRVQSDIGTFLNVVGNVEALTEFAKAKGATISSPEKLDMATSTIAETLRNVELMAHHEIVDEQGIKEAAALFAQASVRLAKAIKPRS